LEKFWKEVCSREFPRVQPDSNESWLEFYHRQLDNSKSKILAAGLRLRDSYRGEGIYKQLFSLIIIPVYREKSSSITNHISNTIG
jgi:hypothetical protein